jgi:hypothetical protein
MSNLQPDIRVFVTNDEPITVTESKTGKWDYHYLSLQVNNPNDFQVMLNGLGEDGWELVCETAFHILPTLPGNVGGSTQQVLLFKRPRSPQRMP